MATPGHGGSGLTTMARGAPWREDQGIAPPHPWRCPTKGPPRHDSPRPERDARALPRPPRRAPARLPAVHAEPPRRRRPAPLEPPALRVCPMTALAAPAAVAIEERAGGVRAGRHRRARGKLPLGQLRPARAGHRPRRRRCHLIRRAGAAVAHVPLSRAALLLALIPSLCLAEAGLAGRPAPSAIGSVQERLGEARALYRKGSPAEARPLFESLLPELRKQPDKEAILYEVVALGTTEEHISRRRGAAEQFQERNRRDSWSDRTLYD